MDGWCWADVWECIADQVPDAQALVHGDRRVTWSEFDRRADGVARALLDAGAQHQDKFAQYLYNCPEYLESVFGACKAGLAPVNTNYRYADDELVYLWDNADVVAVAFHGCFAERIEGIRARVPRVHTWLWVDDGSGPCPDWAIPYEDAAKSAGDRTIAPWGRRGDDLYLLYTGGTTGMPKGVMWRQRDLYRSYSSSNLHDPDEPDLDVVRRRVTAAGPVGLPACPIMHGTGAFTSFILLFLGGSVVTLTSRTFEAEELLDTIERERVISLSIVGDAFAKPMLHALDDHPDRWDVSSLLLITSSGVMWSEQVKQGLLRHNDHMLLVDAFSSSEALGMGSSTSSAGSASSTAKFELGERARVLREDGTDIEPGSGEAGLVAVRGITPIGYYKDPEKSARTFKLIDGETYVVPGDWAVVEADGTLRLMGRGSVCINTGGEKVFPEEVEEALKEHTDVRDAVVVGVPDEKWGEAIVAMVEPVEGERLDEDELITHVKGRLASFKAPKRVLEVATIGRAPNGKVDYKRLREEAVARVG